MDTKSMNNDLQHFAALVKRELPPTNSAAQYAFANAVVLGHSIYHAHGAAWKAKCAPAKNPPAPMRHNKPIYGWTYICRCYIWEFCHDTARIANTPPKHNWPPYGILP